MNARYLIPYSFALLLLATMILVGPEARSQTGGELFGDSLEILSPNRGGSGSEGSGSIYVDSVFYEGRLIRLTVRIADEIRRDSLRLRAVIDSIEHTTQAIVMANLRLDPKDWQPTAADRAEREEMISRAQDREWIYPQGVTRVPVFSAPVGAIARSLGLVEDVTPRISYTLQTTHTITITIYTLSALKVITLLTGQQKAGDHALVWDFNDSNGRRALTGSYIAEVIADGDSLIMRKRIEVP